MIFAYWNVDEGEKCSKKNLFLSPHHQMFTLKYVNRILWRICHANRLLDKCLLELSMMEVIRSVLRRVRRRNPPILSDLSRGWIAMLGVLLFLIIFHTYFSKIAIFSWYLYWIFLFSIHFFWLFFYNFIWGRWCANTCQMVSRYFFIYLCGLYYNL